MSDTGREPLRIGVLGAARITERSLIDPARATGHRLVAVAARDRAPTMKLIDACYREAGFEPRPRTRI